MTFVALSHVSQSPALIPWLTDLPEAVMQANLPLIFTASLALFFLVNLIGRMAQTGLAWLRRATRTAAGPETLLTVHRMPVYGPDHARSKNAGSEAILKLRRFDSSQTAKFAPLLQRIVTHANGNHRVVPHVRLGDVLSPDRGETLPDADLSDLLSRRLDYAILDDTGHLVCGVGDTTRAYTNSKITARILRRAAIPFVEISEPDSAGKLEAALQAALGTHLSEHRHPAVNM